MSFRWLAVAAGVLPVLPVCDVESGPRPTTASAPVNPAVPPRGSDEKARWVGGHLDRVRVGMTRDAVVWLIGETDLPDRVRWYWGWDERCFEERYYVFLTPDRPNIPAAAIYLMSVEYETVNGQDYVLGWRGPHIPCCQ